LGVLALLVPSPEENTSIVLDEGDLGVAAGVVRSGEDAQDSFTGSEFGVLFLGADSECSVRPSGGVFDRDDPVVGFEVENVFDSWFGLRFDHSFSPVVCLPHSVVASTERR
jgi:hypothetical protein